MRNYEEAVNEVVNSGFTRDELITMLDDFPRHFDVICLAISTMTKTDGDNIQRKEREITRPVNCKTVLGSIQRKINEAGEQKVIRRWLRLCRN